MDETGGQRLWQCFEPLEIAPDGCPAFFSIAIPTGRLAREFPNFPMAATPMRGRAANGRGVTRAQCRLSCFGELIELASSCAWGDEPIIGASRHELRDEAIPAEDLIGLSASQYAERDPWNRQYGWFDWRPRRQDPEAVIDWLKVEDAYGAASKFVPADTVLIGRRERGDEEAVAIADSNGCASGETLESAKCSGLLELIERDAVARWWYGRVPGKTVDLTSCGLPDQLGSYLRGRSRRCHLIEITSDLAVPAFVAVTCEPDGTDIATGSAASGNACAAARSAVIEVLQMEVSLEMARSAPGSSHAWDLWRERVTMATSPLNLIGEELKSAHQDTSLNLAACLSACEKADISVYWIDQTRPELSVPSVRVLSPDLCLVKPRFGRKRIYPPGILFREDALNDIPLLV